MFASFLLLGEINAILVVYVIMYRFHIQKDIHIHTIVLINIIILTIEKKIDITFVRASHS